MKLTKQLARKIVFPTILKLGLEKFWRNRAKHNILNVMYHGVVRNDCSYFSPRHLTADVFEKHLQYLTANFDIISIPEAFEMYRKGIKPKRKTITLSFDDGYKNNLEVALPLLEKYNAKTTFFISGICVDDVAVSILWPDIVAALDYLYGSETIMVDEFRFKRLVEERTRIKLFDHIKRQKAKNRDEILNKLVVNYKIADKIKHVPAEAWQLMNKADVQKMAASKIVEIGSHGYLHYNLGIIGLEDAVHDMQRSKQVLEAAIGKPINSIAFPDGSYSPEVKNSAFELGFTNQLAVNYQNNEDGKDTRVLNRHGVVCDSDYESQIFHLSKAFLSKAF